MDPAGAFDQVRRDWLVGLLEHHGDGTGTIHMVVVDGVTGRREEWIERKWDFQVEGFP